MRLQERGPRRVQTQAALWDYTAMEAYAVARMTAPGVAAARSTAARGGVGRLPVPPAAQNYTISAELLEGERRRALDAPRDHAMLRGCEPMPAMMKANAARATAEWAEESDQIRLAETRAAAVQ